MAAAPMNEQERQGPVQVETPDSVDPFPDRLSVTQLLGDREELVGLQGPTSVAAVYPRPPCSPRPR